MTNLMKRSKGMTLVEILVVVAIIGILATISIPQYRKFSARARQASAVSELASIFTAQSSFHGEYNTYHDQLPVMGFVPEGMVSPTAVPATWSYPVVRGIHRYYSSTGGVIAGGANMPPTLPELGLADPGTATFDGFWGFRTTLNDCEALSLKVSGTDSIGMRFSWTLTPNINLRVYTDSFLGGVAGCPVQNLTDDNAGEIDAWLINEKRVIRQYHSGI
jgi:prepilin-type N-terminal cleavage/methylation domain-containing protein